MSISLRHASEIHNESLGRIAAGLIRGQVACIETIGGGRNSQVYRLTGEDSRTYALKLYFRHPLDDRDRLRTEFCSLHFLWDHGIRDIPQPLVANWEQGCALYEYIDGEKIGSPESMSREVDAAIQFLARLKDLGRRTASRELAVASEACFSVQAVVESIHLRLRRLSVNRDTESDNPALGAFLVGEFTPALDAIVRWSRSRLHRSGIPSDQEVSLEERTLSPSDFGFHNALRRKNGQLVFLDFEYFGWDDPAKMIADFLLHPAMDMPESVKQRFAAGVLHCFAEYPRLAERLESVYPLFALKWCLIFLNEFLPEHYVRRRFAGVGDGDRRALQMAQLSKAQRMLHRINEEYERFPYFA